MAETKNATSGQTARQERRNKQGRYTRGYLCEYCGRTVPFAKYFSDDRCNTYGYGQFLHARCANTVAKIPDGEYLDTFKKIQQQRKDASK